VLLQRARFPFFLLLAKEHLSEDECVCVCLCDSIFIHSSINGQLYCFHNLVMVNNVSTNMGGAHIFSRCWLHFFQLNFQE